MVPSKFFSIGNLVFKCWIQGTSKSRPKADTDSLREADKMPFPWIHLRIRPIVVTQRLQTEIHYDCIWRFSTTVENMRIHSFIHSFINSFKHSRYKCCFLIRLWQKAPLIWRQERTHWRISSIESRAAPPFRTSDCLLCVIRSSIWDCVPILYLTLPFLKLKLLGWPHATM